MPHFEYKGMLGGMASFKSHCAFGFWKTKLLLPPSRPDGNYNLEFIEDFVTRDVDRAGD